MSTPGPRVLVAVFVGGAVGSLARHGVTGWVGVDDTVPWGTFAVNLTGAFLLGVVTALVASSLWRSALGTGLIGGFTTYSALALETQDLLRDEPLVAVAYALATLAGGFLLSLAGLALGRRWAR